MKHSLLRSGAGVFTLSLSALAFQHTQQETLPPLNQQHPGPLGMADFGKVVSGNFNGLGKLDAFVMDGNMPKLVISPATHDNAISLGMYANDMAMLPNPNGGAKDWLVTVGPDGLVSHTRNSSTGEFVHTTICGTTTRWLNAKLVRVAQVDSTSNFDIIGVGANGHEIYVESCSSSGPVYTPFTTINVAVDSIYDLVMLNWRVTGDIAGTKEIAAITEDGVAIYEPGGLVVGAQVWASTTNRCAALSSTSWITDRLLMLDMVSGQEQMCIWAPSGAMAGPYPLGLPGIVSIATGDRDGDGDTDVVFNTNTDNKLHIHTNMSASPQTGPMFDPANVTKVSYGVAGRNASLNHSRPAVADWNNDGVLDVAAPSQGDLTGAISHYGTLPIVQFGLGDQLVYRVPISSVVFRTDTQPQQIEITFTAPTLTIPNGPDGPARLGLSVYHTEDLGVGTDLLSIASAFLTMPTTNTPTVYTLVMDPSYDADTDPGIFSIVYHQVATNNDVIVAESASRVALLTGNYNGPTLKGSATTSNQLGVTRIPTTNDPWVGGGAYDPGIPPTDPDLEPEETPK